jgi:membrane protein implicated in regulation of membrane protease activity
VEWWIWLVLGIGLMLGELLTPGGFYLIFFGVGAVATGLAAGMGLAGLTPQVLLFLAVSVSALLGFRRPLLARLRKGQPAQHDELTGEVAVPMAEIAVDAVGQAQLRGTVWSARNAGSRTLQAGERCRVKRVDGLTIYLRPEE